jgi:hypothetical protein
MLVGVCVVFVCASFVQAAEPKLGLVPTLRDPAGTVVDGSAILIFQPWDDVPVIGTLSLFLVVSGLDAGTYAVNTETPSIGGFFTTNAWGTGYFFDSNEPIYDPFLPSDPVKYVRVLTEDGTTLVAEGIVWGPY